MRSVHHPILLLLLALLVMGGCAASQPAGLEPNPIVQPPADQLRYRVFLIGDAGSAVGHPVLTLLERKLAQAGEQSAVVFLGDNIYPDGLVPEEHPDRAQSEERLLVQLRAVEDFEGRIVFIPGNHDWGEDRGGIRQDPEAVARQEAFVESYLDRGDTFLPNDGLPGPVTLELADGITMVVLDTQWWFTEQRATGDAGGYEVSEPADVLAELSDVLYRNRKDHLLVVGHHPLRSNGPHGGRFAWRDYLSPFPVYGAITPLRRRFFGNRQDLASPPYRSLRREVGGLLARQEHVVYAAGHEHSLQHFRALTSNAQTDYVVSGAGSGASYSDSDGALFARSEAGFASIGYYADGSSWLEMWTPSDSDQGRMLYRTRLKPAAAQTPDSVSAAQPASVAALPDSMTLAAGARYAGAGSVRTLIQGEGWRDVWGTPVTAPVLDIGTDLGGLTPIRTGGNSQSTTLWLRAADGKTWMLRSIDKATARSWSPQMRRTLAGTVIQERIGLQHPYGALMVPPLGDAVGMLHTNPRLVYVPDDPRMGPFQGVLAGQIVLLEERPDEDMSDVPSMGGATNVIGSAKLFREIDGDNDHRVEADSWVRSRLVDMLVSDHDRTTDNVRWAAFEPHERDSTLTGDDRTQGKVYVPIPRDRDMAFLQVDGLAPRAYRYFAEPTWQDFDDEYGMIGGLNSKPMPLDRRFAAALTGDDWTRIAREVQASLTDSVLLASVQALPPPVYRQSGDETLRILRERRDDLVRVAERYYAIIAQAADVVGSHKHERFEITEHADGTTEIAMFKTSKEGEIRKELFRRVYRPSETQEIRLYGRGGRDHFVVQGPGPARVLVRAIGGAGEDTFDLAGAAGRGNKLMVYDTPASTEVASGPRTHLMLSDDLRVNRYDRMDFRLNRATRVPILGYTPDDGLVVGAAGQVTRFGFRKAPFSYQHRILARFGTADRAFDLQYRGLLPRLFGAWDLDADVSIETPGSDYNYYGLGNETVEARSNSFYRTQFGRITARPLLSRRVAPGVTFRAGPDVAYIDVQEDGERFSGTPQAGISDGTFGRLLFAGATSTLDVDAVDLDANPRQGFRWRSSVTARAGLSKSADPYARMGSALTLYLTPTNERQFTIATRVGAETVIGSFPFFDAATLGASSGLRGYRSTRFAGRTSFYQNLDLRVELLSFSGLLGYGELGALVFADNGRVWTDDESSRRWHQGYGGGLWAYIYDAATVVASYGRSVEGGALTVGLGFAF